MIALIDIAAAIACVVCAIMFGKRVGGAGPWLIAAVAAFDALLIVVFRVYYTVMRARGAYGFDSTLTLMQAFDAFATFVMSLVIVVACGLLMPRATRR